MLDAGFVDVKSRKFKVELGDWGPGLLLAMVILIVDPQKHQAARIAAKIWSLAMEPLAEQMTRYIPNDQERSTFMTRRPVSHCNADRLRL